MAKKKLSIKKKNGKWVILWGTQTISWQQALVVGVVSLVLVALGIGTTSDYLDLPGVNAPSNSTTTVKRPKGEFVLEGRITHVADGDTINIQVAGVRERVRLANIDSPETTGRADRPGQPYANEAQQALERMVLNKNLRLRCFEQDHYGRNVCDIPLPNGKTANQQMVEQGWAWAYTGSNERYLRDKSLKAVQARAQQQRIGLWQAKKSPIAPWVWRVQCWQQKKCD
ncbi:thermonuclease family protein [Paenalcaligenes hominis]|uniref:thermonuclease family protein n=1 Tax=Paenalcaligenes hominis TaxID=643674 RepID=UPI003525A8C8